MFARVGVYSTSTRFPLTETAVDSCYKCAFKHLSMAKKVWTELHTGYAGDIPHIASLIGDLACAEAHLFEKQPDLAAAIRTDRRKIFDEVLAHPDKPPDHKPDFNVYLDAVFQLEVIELSTEKDKGVSTGTV